MITSKSVDYAKIWFELCGKEGKIYSSVDEALARISSLYLSPCHVLVTGSLHLVGNTTYYLQPDIWD